MDETKHKLPENATWGDAMGLIADLVSEVKAYHDGWATEVIAQAKRNTLHWVVAFWLTLAALVVTNAYWIYTVNNYEYVYQDGTGQNNYNNNVAGDVNNVAAGESEEEWQEPGSEAEENR